MRCPSFFKKRRRDEKNLLLLEHLNRNINI